MRHFLFFLFAFLCLDAQSQRLQVGFHSGTGFSDYHGYSYSGKWESSAGALSGVFIRFAVTPVIGLGTELNFSRQSYRYKPYQEYTYYPNEGVYPLDYWPFFSSSYVPFYYTAGGRWDFSFWRIPLYITLSTPTRLQFSFSAGVYVSFTKNHDFTPQTISYYPYYWNSIIAPGYSADEDPPRHDNGLLYAASLSYPLSDEFRIYAMGRYFIGHKDFFNEKGRTGNSELAFGIAYTGLFKSKTQENATRSDSATSRLRIKPGIGFAMSHFRHSAYPDRYALRTSVTPAILVEWKLDNFFSLVSGVSFERKGYHMKDSSIYFYRYARDPGRTYQADTRVDLDYALIPLVLKVKIGAGERIYLLAGTYLGIKLNARVTGKAQYETSSTSGYTLTKVDVYDDIEGTIKNTDWGWILGAGTELPLSNGKKLEFSLQYAFGKQNILIRNEYSGYEYEASDDKIRNGSLIFLAGISFPFQKAR